MRTKRLFLGVKPEADILKDLVRYQQAVMAHGSFRRFGARVRPVAVDCIHLTLHFLGDTYEDRMGDIRKSLAPCQAQGKTHQVLNRFLALPSPDSARVGCLGAEVVDPALLRLQISVGNWLAGVGFAVDSRPYLPHITLLRFQSPVNLRKFESAPDVPAPLVVSLMIERLSLYESLRRGSVSRYEILEEFPLAPL